MLKKISVTLILGTLLILFMAPQRLVQGDQVNTQAVVELQPQEPTAPVDPVDPSNPDEKFPGDGSDQNNQGTGTVDRLSLDYVSNLHFQTTTKQANLTAPLINERAMIQITDRRATGSGWVLQLQPAALVGQQTQAKITTGLLILGTTTLNTTSRNVSAAPQLVAQQVTIGEYSNILRAAPGQGLGTWVLGLPPSQTQPTQLVLNNLATVPTDHYAGVLNWSLTDAPN